MAFLQDLIPEQVQEVVRQMAEINARLALTVRYPNRWVTLRTHTIAQFKGFLWVEMPAADEQAGPHKFEPGEQVGLTFTQARRKYIFRSEVVGLETYNVGKDKVSTALKLTCPKTMHRVERRLYSRHELPSSGVTRATFWLGGCEARPAEESVEAPIWSGRILNLSSGGMLVRTSYEAAKYVETGDVLGIHIMFGSDEQAAFIDGQLRHCERDHDMALMGIQFVEAEENEHSKAAIQMIRAKIEANQAKGD